MTTLPEMTRAASVISLNGSEYKIRALRLSDFAEFERWVEDEPLRRTLRNLSSLPAELHGQALREAQQEISRTKDVAGRNPGQVADMLLQRQQRVAAAMMSVEGTIQVLWLSLRAEQPETTPAIIADKVGLDNLPYIHDKLDEMNGFSRPSPARAARPASPTHLGGKGPSRPRKNP